MPRSTGFQSTGFRYKASSHLVLQKPPVFYNKRGLGSSTPFGDVHPTFNDGNPIMGV